MAHARPTEASSPGRILDRLSFPFREFVHNQAFSGVLLLACAGVALVWANSPWAWAYQDLWATPLTIGPGDLALSKPLQLWVNDALMAIFFFVVGLEIKRELLVGELASPRRVALPMIAAVGGAAVPALIYAALNAGTIGSPGWGIPMATDIAFALGVLALLGDRVPAALKVFLASLAIVDDLMAVLVIAVFYTASISGVALAVAALFFAALVLANRLGVRRPLVYGLLGVGLWVAVLESGVHATIAGVLLATTIPARNRIDQAAFLARGRALLDDFAWGAAGPGALPDGDQQAALSELESATAAVQSPLQRLEHGLHPWVAFVIMPVFALANAGVSLEGMGVGALLDDRIALGIVLGLVVGKQIGITAAAWLATRLGLAVLPAGVTWPHVYGVAWLGGVGFTMSLFIAGLAFADEAALTSAKIGVLLASAIAGSVGFLLLRAAGQRT